MDIFLRVEATKWRSIKQARSIGKGFTSARYLGPMEKITNGVNAYLSDRNLMLLWQMDGRQNNAFFHGLYPHYSSVFSLCCIHTIIGGGFAFFFFFFS